MHVCNHSPNRFATPQACQETCVLSQQPSERCFDRTIFSWCNSHDLNVSWWFFDGNHCRAWHFPEGLCPSPSDGDVFHNLDECRRRCSRQNAPHLHDRKHGTRRSQAPCRAPAASTTCSADLLRFPYFAQLSAGDGRIRCIRASEALLLTHRCLIGSNRFDDERACERACVDGADRRERRPEFIET
ncbi:uncharacterized protein LOC144152827 [Haemaphysalis longicornis]